MTPLSTPTSHYRDLPTEANRPAQIVLVILDLGGILVMTLVSAVLIVLNHPPSFLIPVRLVLLEKQQQLFPDQYVYKNDQEKQAVADALDQFDPVKQARAFENVITINPSPRNYFYLGIAYWEEGEKQQARMALETAIHKDPQFAPAQAYYGYLLGLKSGFNDFTQGKAAILKATTLDPIYVPNYYFLSLLWSQQGNYQEAKRAIDLAVVLEPDNLKYREIQQELDTILIPTSHS